MSIARSIELTNLDLMTTSEEVRQLCQSAQSINAAAVCIHPRHVALIAHHLHGMKIDIVSVCAFPHGANKIETTLFELKAAVTDGATAVDIVANHGLIREQQYDPLAAELILLRAATPLSIQLRLIIEAGHLLETEIAAAVETCIACQFDFVKTGTGIFGPVTPQQVELFRSIAHSRIRIKAAGGIRSLSQARLLLAAGADRLGTSHGAAIVAEENETVDEKK